MTAYQPAWILEWLCGAGPTQQSMLCEAEVNFGGVKKKKDDK